VEQFGEYELRPYLLFLGDTTFNFQFAKVFFSELRKLMPYATIFTVLGNHELWDDRLYKSNDDPNRKVEKVVKTYRRMFDELGIIMIHNELVVYQDTETGDPINNLYRLSEDELLSKSAGEIRDFVRRSRLTILGGIGFSGYEPEFNASKGLYDSVLQSMKEDLHQTMRFEQIYLKCKSILADKQVIVLTHTPKENWSKDDYGPNWIYTNGHTHQDRFEMNDKRTIFADNQIGYYSKNLVLKHFYTSAKYDIFGDYSDGIYPISKKDFQDFYRGKGKYVRYSKKNTQIYMLKKNGVYCFIQKHLNTGSLCVLNGGSPIKMKSQRELEYYYEKLDVYSQAVEEFLQQFNESLDSISEFVRAFGGSGRIHGFIVDIDYYNHLYLNPFDGSVTPYYATSIVDKHVYQNVASLLKYRNKALYNRYVKLIDSESDVAGYGLLNRSHETSKETVHSDKTEIYKFSRIAKALQYLKQIQVVRMWNDSLVEQTNGDRRQLIDNLFSIEQRE
jgi:predicted MPP superfamily phosphohydrolase